ncbi:MAG: FAD-dependent oxidoreductase [Clostridiaceae bacterium]
MSEILKAREIKQDFYWVGVQDPELRIFDIIMYTPFGTTYNSYVLKSNDRVALFETVKEKFFDQYIARLKSLEIDLEKVDYIIVDHTEPDHAGSVAKMLKLAKNAKVVGSATAIRFLKAIVNDEFEYIIANHNETLTLGEKTLKFISAPFLHWPDSMYTYIEEDNILVTCDSFGSHYCDEGITNENLKNDEDYMTALKYYYDCIFGPFKPYVLKAIDKIKDLKIDTIAVGHGPVLTKEPEKIVEIYKKWSTPTPKTSDVKNIVICYVSAYGYTKSLAEKIAEGIKSTGEYNIELLDVIYHELDTVLEKINNSDGVLFGSPTILSDALKPIMDILINLNPIIHIGKPTAAFGSFGWSGEAVPNIEARLKQLRMNIIVPGLKVNFNPSESEFNSAFEFGEKFGNVLSGKEEVSTETKQETKVSKKSSNGFWKCLICGVIFEGEAPPDTCPVCGAGSDQFVEVENEEVTFSSEENLHVVIIGNGAAGYYASEAIRKRNKVATIDIISGETYKTYYRPSLSDYLTEELGEDFYVVPDSWYDENNVRLHLGTFVNKIDTNNKKLLLSDGKEMTYDKLVLGMGSQNFIPPITGAGKKGVYTLKDLNDAKTIRNAISKSNKAVVIGGGLLGLEAAWEMKKTGLDVTVIEFFNRLLPRQIDDAGSELFLKLVEKSGVNIILEDSVVEIQGGNSAQKVITKGGTEISADIVLLSTGIKPNIELAKEAGIETNRGIVINDKMETNFKDIYAAGDVAEFKGIVFGNWTAAISMAEVAGTNLIGDTAKFEAFVSSVIFKALGVELVSFGSISSEGCKAMEIKDDVKNTMKKLFFKDDILVGGYLIGDLSDIGKLLEAMKSQKTLKDVLLVLS